MSKFDFYHRTKPELLQIVEYSNIMPLDEARQMRVTMLKRLLEQLASANEEVFQTAIDRLAKERENSKNILVEPPKRRRGRPSKSEQLIRMARLKQPLTPEEQLQVQELLDAKTKLQLAQNIKSPITDTPSLALEKVDLIDPNKPIKKKRGRKKGSTYKRSASQVNYLQEELKRKELDPTFSAIRLKTELKNNLPPMPEKTLRLEIKEQAQKELLNEKVSKLYDLNLKNVYEVPVKEDDTNQNDESVSDINKKDSLLQDNKLNIQMVSTEETQGQSRDQLSKETKSNHIVEDIKPLEEKKKDTHQKKQKKKKNKRIDQDADDMIEENHVDQDVDHLVEEPEKEEAPIITGVLELMSDGYGFLRTENYIQSANDVYVSHQYVRRFGLRKGDIVSGSCRNKREQDRYQAINYIVSINGEAPETMKHRPHFERLTPIYPNDRCKLETVKEEFSTRMIDLIAPIGKGQRGMIVSQPKAGKTILLQKIANAITKNNPEMHLMVLLIDERPEEVTDMQRSIDGEVIYSTFDKTPENHVHIAELVLERAMRMVELGQDVIILLDSITRLARAYNLTINPTGRTLSGGLDPGALYGPKRFFGAARNIEHGGSLTIVATALIETGSRMDEVIFEEFKGTGNMEVYLDRKLSEKRVFPAIDLVKSGTRREDLLLSKPEMEAIWAIRKALSNLDSTSVTETIISLLTKTTSNEYFVSSINRSLNDKQVVEKLSNQRYGQVNKNTGKVEVKCDN